MMQSIGDAQLRDLVLRQLCSMWPTEELDASLIEGAIPNTMVRLEACFSRVRNKYYSDARGMTRFDQLHGCQWAHFLYTLARQIWIVGGVPLTVALR